MINKEQSLIKTILPHLIAVVAFLAITLVYFSPILDGKVLSQSDVNHYQGVSQELREYYYDEGKSSAWTGSMFSGMPAYQIGIMGGVTDFLNYVEKPFKLLGNNTAGPVFMAMLMAYILFVLMGFSPIVSALGAVAYSFSSYNFIILEGGHVTKAWALAYLPLIVASIMVLFKNKILLGGMLMALGLALQIKNNHLQMTYYTGILCLVLYIGYIVDRIRKKEIKILLKASAVMVVALILAIGCSMSNIYANMEMAETSIRGKSELTTPTQTEKQSSGLDKDYAFAWSYGKAETLTLMIPNFYGGASGGTLDKSSNLYKEMVKQGFGAQAGADGVQSYTYWGTQPFTQGPVYFGAIICFLFILGMIVIRSKMKWWLFAATVLFIFLSWGRNMEWFNDLFFYYFPLYNKFRAVSSALVIPALTIVIIAVWAIKDFFSGEIPKEKLKKALYISAGVTGGLCLFFWLAPGFFFNFVSEGDAAWKSQMPDWYYNALVADRKDLLSSDAFRSLAFIVLAAGVLFFSLRTKMEATKVALYSSVAIIFLVLIDMWGVDKRYLNDSNFMKKETILATTFPQTVADKAILKDKHPSYRVLNLNNTFQDSKTSYFHKSIGGYHAAKLKSYQELIEYRLANELNAIVGSFQSQNVDTIMASFANLTALNMLNAKYVIYHPDQPPLQNPDAMGNAWFVSEYKFVENADQEIAALNTLDAQKTAIIDKRFENELSGLTILTDSTATIELVEYKPDMVKYKSKAASEQLAVLSEIYYANGWQAYLDGNKVPHFRADWTLRAMRVPVGEHEIVFKFEPQDYFLSRKITTFSSLVVVLLLILSLGFYIKKSLGDKKEN